MDSNPFATSRAQEPVVLGAIENYFWRFDQDLSGTARVAVLLRLNGCIETEFLARALSELQLRHPKLRAGMAEGADGRLRYHFQPAVPPIPLAMVDYFDEEAQWREATRELLQREMPAGGPLAAVTVLRNRQRNTSELIFMFAHAIADGMSAIMLLHELLTAYARAEAHLESPPPQSLPLITSPRVTQPATWRNRLRLLRRFARIMREEDRLGVTSLPEAAGIAPQSQWVHWVFSREQTLSLVRRCRKEETSFGGTLVAAVFCGLMDCLDVPEALFKWQLPFNLRENLEGPHGKLHQDLGCFISGMNALSRVPAQPSFWEVARQAHQEIQSFMRAGGPIFAYTVSSFLYSVRAMISRFLSRREPRLTPSTRHRETLGTTHYGVVNISEAYGTLGPRECTLLFNHEVGGPSLIIEGLVLGQRLNIGFAADDLEPAFWQRLHAAVRRHLDSAMSAEPSKAQSISARLSAS
ncbi:MAG: hypothetical protein JO336_02140 [Acidobacteriia bacterium]|nr:hypothetical protein [Terriglobia bacterium]MBV8905743.1 hypothetical protein [Terriglobia bacterium]